MHRLREGLRPLLERFKGIVEADENLSVNRHADKKLHPRPQRRNIVIVYGALDRENVPN